MSASEGVPAVVDVEPAPEPLSTDDAALRGAEVGTGAAEVTPTVTRQSNRPQRSVGDWRHDPVHLWVIERKKE